MTFTDERARALSGADADVSLLAVAQYFRELAWTEPTSVEEEEKLLRRVSRGNAEQLQPCPNQWVLSLAKHARERLVEVYQPLVAALARRRLFLFKSMELLDVIQEGNIGLLDALDSYDDEVARLYPYRFSIVAAGRVKRALSSALAERDMFIRLPGRKYEMVRDKSCVESALRKYLGRQPLLSEIAEMMDVSEESLQQVLDAAKRREVRSLHEMIERREVNEDKMSFTSLYMAAEGAEDTRQAELAATFQRVFEVAMPPKQRDVLELRFCVGDVPGSMRSQNLVAEMLDASPGEVSASERQAKRRLSEFLEPVILDDGRLSCTFQNIYSDDYCTSGEAAMLLGVTVSSMNKYARQGLLPFEMRLRCRRSGSKERVFRKADILAFRRARGSALLPSVVA